MMAKVNGIFSEIMRLEGVVENCRQAEADATYNGEEQDALFYYDAYLDARACLARAKRAWEAYKDAQQGEAVLVGSF